MNEKLRANVYMALGMLPPFSSILTTESAMNMSFKGRVMEEDLNTS